MSEYELHRPRFSATTRNNWEFPSEAGVDTDDLPAVADRFLLSKSGFDDPDSFDDLALPVVTERGELSYNALWAAKRGPYGVEGIPDLDAETRADAEALIDEIGHEQFEGFDDVTLPAASWRQSKPGSEAITPTLESTDDSGVFGVGRVTPSAARAAVGLVFLTVVSIAIEWFRE
ncbi:MULTISPECIES: hypothetical protein [Halococcus]|uniref:Uncharacterized protein n=1 Tax=Halococcus salifodinae DSM 8989 TaxID=1227456 RepID=M0N7K6_9EURY|nr:MULTISPECIES: hypothetical protein [Halococcus]EMA52655.1 hypothetical protein C450_11168 [Halococcus salifodinae DSM 8989]